MNTAPEVFTLMHVSSYCRTNIHARATDGVEVIYRDIQARATDGVEVIYRDIHARATDSVR